MSARLGRCGQQATSCAVSVRSLSLCVSAVADADAAAAAELAAAVAASGRRCRWSERAVAHCCAHLSCSVCVTLHCCALSLARCRCQRASEKATAARGCKKRRRRCARRNAQRARPADRRPDRCLAPSVDSRASGALLQADLRAGPAGKICKASELTSPS